MVYSIDKILEAMPHYSIPPIIGQPTYSSIHEIHQYLSSNAASIQSNLGCGTLGLIYLTLSPTVYANLSATLFIPSPNPGATAKIISTATAAQTSSIRRAHNEPQKSFKEYDNTDKEIKKLLISAVENIFLRAIRACYMGYANITTRQMLMHLYMTYTNITPAKLNKNNARLKTAYDVNQPIEQLFEKIEDAVEYADADHNSYTPLQVVTNAFQLVFQTCTFVQDCKDWKRTTPAYNTWANFKTFFDTAHQEWRESQATTSGNMYSTAPISGTSSNAVHQHNETANAITCLDTTTAAN